MSCVCHDPLVFGHLCNGQYTSGDILTITPEVHEPSGSHWAALRALSEATTVTLAAIREVLTCLKP